MPLSAAQTPRGGLECWVWPRGWVQLKSHSAYVVAFVAGVSRELGDLVGGLGKPQPSTGVILGVLVFVIASTMGALAANKARGRQA